MRRMIKRILTALCAVCLMCPFFSTAAFAANAHFTFWNTHETQPDLYIAKSVSSAMDGYSVPAGTEFTFVLKWDQDGDGILEFAENARYYIYNMDGMQVKNPDTSDGFFRTSSTGRFTLQDGQYARFEWAGEVEYEITELETENYIQISPSGNEPATGMVDAEGTMITFENLYIPVKTEGETTRLAVRKDIQWPGGYEMPDFSDTEFTFQVTLDGSLYGGKVYTVYNTDMTQELSTGRTESNGTFTMGGDQMVVFEDVETGVDYKIEEVNTQDGWRAVGNTSYEGATVSPILFAYFTNAGASFSVRKERSDGVIGEDGGSFTFILSDDSGNAMSDIFYYLYDEDGKLLASDISTKEDGSFTLVPGQTVIFTGIPDGMKYQITEEQADHFESLEAHDGVLDYNTVVEHTFTNNPLTNITVKKAENNNINHLLGGAEFTIYSLKDGIDPDSATDEDWEAYPNIEEAVRLTEEDEDSSAFGTCTFNDLPAGTYKIEETNAPLGYIKSKDPIIITLPYSMTDDEVSAEHINTESEDFTGIWSDRDSTYYFYNITYDVTNQHTLMEMPHAGGWGWIYFVLVLIGCIVAGISVYIQNRRNRKMVMDS